MAADDRNDRERLKAIEMAVGQIEKQFGKGSIMRLGAKDVIAQIPAISTGSISLDYALGIGGMPRGRVIEIFGPESSGKTTLALQVIAQAQKTGGMAAFVDAEHALDAQYARKLGVDLENLLISQPDNGEQALEIVEVLVRSGAVDVVVVDSVAALVPRAEIEGEMGEAQMGLQARLMSQALRKLTGIVSKSKTCLIFINQLREKIGVMFGNPETTTGGRALKFYASVRVDIRRIGAIKDGDVVVGGRTRVKVVKNKVAPPFREAEFDVMYGEGISREGDLLDLAVDRKIVEKSGTWFAYSGERLGQGRENVKQFLRDNPDTFRAIEAKVRKELGLITEEVAAVEGDRAALYGPPCRAHLQGRHLFQRYENAGERGRPGYVRAMAAGQFDRSDTELLTSGSAGPYRRNRTVAGTHDRCTGNVGPERQRIEVPERPSRD
jgi:recombination protein RecA